MIVGGNKVNSNDTKYDLTKDEYNKCLLMAEIATFIKSERSSFFLLSGCKSGWYFFTNVLYAFSIISGEAFLFTSKIS